jgi:leucine dehydrogenase
MLDALRLSQAMSYKSAAAGLALGGGKGVIWADPHHHNREALLRAYARQIDSLGGRYITTTDVGTTIRDLEMIRLETQHVVGLPTEMGGSGSTSILTGLGVYLGMKACAKSAWGSDSLQGRVVAMQGFGKVAHETAEHLLREGVRLVVTDISQNAMDEAASVGAKVVETEEIYDVDCDIFSPCALGSTLNTDTIQRLNCAIVAGGANNQLATDLDGKRLQDRGIIYAPDYIINAGGIINASCEIGAEYNEARARQITERIYDTMRGLLHTAQQEEITTAEAADRLAAGRIAAVHALRGMYRSN